MAESWSQAESIPQHVLDHRENLIQLMDYLLTDEDIRPLDLAEAMALLPYARSRGVEAVALHLKRLHELIDEHRQSEDGPSVESYMGKFSLVRPYVADHPCGGG